MAADPDLILALVGSSTFTAVIAAILNGVFNRKRLGAEATEIITNAASGVVASLSSDLNRKHQEVARLQDRIEALEEREETWETEKHLWRIALQTHAAFDFLAMQKLREAGILDLPEPPPLYPATVDRS